MGKKQLVYIPVSPKHELPESGVWVDTNKGQLMYSHDYGWTRTGSVLTTPPLYWYKQELFYCLTKEELEELIGAHYVQGQNNGSDAEKDISNYVHFLKHIESLNLK